MASAHVRKTSGNDANDGLTDGTAKASVEAGYALLTTNGDTLTIDGAEGEYTCNSVATGGMRWVHALAAGSGYTIRARVATKKPIIRNLNDTVAFAHLIQGKHVFQDIIFAATTTTANKTVVRLNNANSFASTFDDCTLDGSRLGGTCNVLLANFTGPGTGLAVRDCLLIGSSVNPVDSACADFTGVSGGCTIAAWDRTVAVNGACRFENCAGVGADSLFAAMAAQGVAVSWGKDGDSGGAATTMSFTRPTAWSNGTHGALVGDGYTTGTIDGLRVPYCIDDGLVVKAQGGTIKNGHVRAGGSAAKTALYCKGGSGPEIFNMVLEADGTLRRCIGFTQSGLGAAPANYNIHDNRCVALNGAEVYLLPAADYGTGNTIDDDVFYVDGTSTYGNVKGTTSIASLAAVRTAHANSNDATSRAATGTHWLSGSDDFQTYAAAADVRLGTDRGDGVAGSLAVPAAANVLAGAAVDAGVGTLTLPSAGLVFSGVVYGVGGNGSTGTLVTGAGSYLIDEGGGTGLAGAAATLDAANSGTFATFAADALQVTSDGSTPVAGITVRAFAKAAPADSTVTGADGRFAEPLGLASGDFYLVFDVPGDNFKPYLVTIRVP